MEKTWVLVANASKAVLYHFVPPGAKEKPKLMIVDEFSHPESREKDHDLTSDREGEYISKPGGHGNFIEASDPHKYEAKVFAHQLFQKLEQGRVGNQYQKLVLVAAPHFLGLLRQEIDERPLKKVTIKEITKDYTGEPSNELIKLLDLR